MNQLSIYFLAFLTFWTSTWMVVDIHDVPIVDKTQLHHIFVEQHTHTVPDTHLINEHHSHDSHCGVCSYDHGGHIGQTLASIAFVAKTIPAQSSINIPLNTGFWYSRKTPPKVPPPITA